MQRGGAENAEAPQREVTELIIGAAIEVHRWMGPGLLESVYQQSLQIELTLRGIRFEAQVSVPLVYKGRGLGAPLKLDLLVEGVVIVEIKALQALEPVHAAQLLTYLRLTGLSSGLLLNFNEVTLKQGIQRVSNSLRPSAFSAPLR
ncbi:MAG: GxxExxY protein [Polaromonas sp.]|nr:MAG: GxxExxY protein [Polaromonas sp.]